MKNLRAAGLTHSVSSAQLTGTPFHPIHLRSICASGAEVGALREEPSSIFHSSNGLVIENGNVHA